VVSESQFNIGPTAFSLSSLGDELVLTAADATGAPTGSRTQFNFGAAADNVSFGFVATAGAAEFWPQTSRTPSNPNSSPVIGPVIISEIHYHPPDFSGTDNTRDEFIELQNITTSPVNLAGWKLKGGSDYAFPSGAMLLPGGSILIVSFDPAADPVSLAAFRTTYHLSEGLPIFGPYAPKLPNDSTNVELAYSGTAVGGVIPLINVDKVEYTDVAPWPVTPDGSGVSLQRITGNVIGNDPGNWQGAAPTPIPAFVDNDGDGLPDTWEDANGFDKLNPADGDVDTDGDGQNNLSEFVAGTNPRNAIDVLKIVVQRHLGGALWEVNFRARAGRSYVVEYKNSLADEIWKVLANVPAPAADTDISIPDPTILPQRFYRARTPGP
jgi:hypothetical protein